MRFKAIVLLLLLVLFCVFPIFAQQNSAGQGKSVEEEAAAVSNYDRFLARTGLLITKRVYRVGQLDTDTGILILNAVMMSARGEEGGKYYGASVGEPRVDRHALDFVDLVEIRAAIDTLLETHAELSAQAESVSFATFTTTNRAVLSFYPRAYKNSPKGFVILSLRDGGSFQFPVEALPKVKEIIVQAIEKLKTLGA